MTPASPLSMRVALRGGAILLLTALLAFGAPMAFPSPGGGAARAANDRPAADKPESPAPPEGASNEKAPAAGAGPTGESIDAALCRLIDGAAGQAGLPAAFLTRLIWRESAFRSHVVSRAGAQGIAQFMPGTARERGLVNPFDPEEAIPASAALLSDLLRRFGNLGLAAAAYNAGPGRVSAFLAGGGLPQETRTYVRLITGRTAEDWAALQRQAAPPPEDADAPCLATLAALRQGAPAPEGEPNALFAPWGVQISGNFSKDLALASFRRAAGKYQAVFGDQVPVILATRMAGRGARTFYRVRLPAQTRAEANALCTRLRKAGGPCIVLPN
ncbi:lytic transglycosylase domain-containing protein [Xanthobacter sediminis]